MIITLLGPGSEPGMVDSQASTLTPCSAATTEFLQFAFAGLKRDGLIDVDADGPQLLDVPDRPPLRAGPLAGLRANVSALPSIPSATS
jgi:hypothetical protein